MSPDELISKCRAIRTVVTDVDGVLTDGGMYYGESGEELKKFNVRDGAGIALLKLGGIAVGAITGESCKLITRRIEKIGCDFCYTGAGSKLACLNEHVSRNALQASEVAYIGDEINDFCLLNHVGVFFAVRDACPEIRDRADHILLSNGGGGALREVAAIVLEAQGKLEAALEAYGRKVEE